MRGKRYKSFQTWGHEERNRKTKSKQKNFDKFKDINKERSQNRKQRYISLNEKRKIAWKQQRLGANQSSWTWIEDDSNINRNIVNPSVSDQFLQQPRAVHSRYGTHQSPQPRNNLNAMMTTATNQHTQPTYSYNNTNTFVKIESHVPLIPLELPCPFTELPKNNYTNYTSTTPIQQRNHKRYFEHDPAEYLITNNNEVRPANIMPIKIEPITPSSSPEPEVNALSPEVIDLTPEVQIVDDDESYMYNGEKSSTSMTSPTSFENSAIAVAETESEAEVTQVNVEEVQHEPRKTAATKKKRIRRKQDACEICDIQGHNEMQCQMICRNCREPFHNSSKCSQPAKLHNTLTRFMESCIKQFITEEQNK